MSTVWLEAVSKFYGDFKAVDAVDLTIDEGELVTLLGPSGCGKTTSLRMIAGFVRPSDGRIAIGERDVTGVPPHKRLVGFVFQNYALFPHMNVRDNIGFGLKMRHVPQAERGPRIDEALDLVQMSQLGDRLPAQLSGGQQQRVALARALVIRPDVLLLDEPFGALDKQLRDHMRLELRNLQNRVGITTVFVTHDQDEALSMSDRICVMNHGRIEQIASPAEIYEHPKTRFVAEFMGRSNLLQGEMREDGAFYCGDLRLPLEGKGEIGSATAMIRPERIGLGHGELMGRITGQVYLGAIIEHEVTLATGQVLQIMEQNPGPSAIDRFPANSEVQIDIPRDAVYLIL